MGGIIGERFIHRAINVLKFSINAIKALAGEVFSLTEETRGGLMLIAIFFYSAYVLGATMWVEGGGHFKNCHGVGECTYTLIRLTFLDGSGFDFAYNLTKGHPILFIITMMYLVITALGILNGLVGIFGSLIATASIQAFDENQENIAFDQNMGASSDDNVDDNGAAKDGDKIFNTNSGPYNEEESDGESSGSDNEGEKHNEGGMRFSEGAMIVNDARFLGDNTSSVGDFSLSPDKEATKVAADVSVIDLEAGASATFAFSPVPSNGNGYLQAIPSKKHSHEQNKKSSMHKYSKVSHAAGEDRDGTKEEDEDDDEGDVKHFDCEDEIFSSESFKPSRYPGAGQTLVGQSSTKSLLNIKQGSSHVLATGLYKLGNKSMTTAGSSMHNVFHAAGGGSKFVMQQLAKRSVQHQSNQSHAGVTNGLSAGSNNLPSFFAPKVVPASHHTHLANANSDSSELSLIDQNVGSITSSKGQENHPSKQLTAVTEDSLELTNAIPDDVRKKSVRNRFQLAAHLAKAANTTNTVGNNSPWIPSIGSVSPAKKLNNMFSAIPAHNGHPLAAANQAALVHHHAHGHHHSSLSNAPLPPAISQYLSDQAQMSEKHALQLDALTHQIQAMQQTMQSQQDMMHRMMESITQVTQLLLQQHPQQRSHNHLHLQSPHTTEHQDQQHYHHHHSHAGTSDASPTERNVSNPDLHLKSLNRSGKIRTPSGSAAVSTTGTAASAKPQGMQLLDIFRPRSAKQSGNTAVAGATTGTMNGPPLHAILGADGPSQTTTTTITTTNHHYRHNQHHRSDKDAKEQQAPSGHEDKDYSEQDLVAIYHQAQAQREIELGIAPGRRQSDSHIQIGPGTGPLRSSISQGVNFTHPPTPTANGISLSPPPQSHSQPNSVTGMAPASHNNRKQAVIKTLLGDDEGETTEGSDLPNHH